VKPPAVRAVDGEPDRRPNVTMLVLLFITLAFVVVPAEFVLVRWICENGNGAFSP
jgi:hypothetical protein